MLSLAFDGDWALTQRFGANPHVYARLRFACRGYPGTDGRIAIEHLTGTFQHDRQWHPELRSEAL